MFILYDFTQFKPKFSGGGPPTVISLIHFTMLKQTPRMWFCLEKTPWDVIFIKIIVCRAVSMAKIDFDHTKATGRTDRQTDGWTKWSLCAYVPLIAMLHRRHKNGDEIFPCIQYYNNNTHLFKSKFTCDVSVCDLHFTVLIDPSLPTEQIVNTRGDLVPYVMVLVPVIEF